MTVVVNGSVTPKVRRRWCSAGSGLEAMSSSGRALPEAEREGDAEGGEGDDQPVPELVEMLDEGQLILVGNRPDSAGHRARLGTFVGDRLALAGLDLLR